MKKHFHKLSLLATTLLFTLATHATEANTHDGAKKASLKAEFTVLKRFPLAGEGGWDYLTVDAPHHHLFISRSTHVQVMDTETGALVGDILNTPGVHGIALAPQLDKGFISNGRDNSVTVISLSTLLNLNKIPTPEGKKPDFIFFEPSTEDVYVFNGQSNNATVIDAKTDQIKGTVALSGIPEAAVSDLNGYVYVALEDKNAVAKIKQSHLHEAAVFKVPHCDEPAGLAISQRTKELFVGCHNKGLYLVDSQTGKTLSALLFRKHTM
jgi:YVTN family beta-propeller protein